MTRRTDPDYPGGDDWFVRKLAAEIPELTPLLAEHIRENGQVLPYVFLGVYVWPWFKEQFDAGTPEGLRLCRRFVDMLATEQARGDEDTSNLIGVEFLENLMEGMGGESIRPLLPPVLAAELERMENWEKR